MDSFLIEYGASFAAVAGVMLLALLSPGPDFAIIARNSLTHSRQTALLTAVSVAGGIAIHLGYTLAGLEFVLEDHPWSLQVVQYLGAAYLLYIGIKGLMSQKKTSLHAEKAITDLTVREALSSGFFTSVLNPNAILFFISLVALMVPTKPPPHITFMYGGMLVIQCWLWFSFMAYCLTIHAVQSRLTHYTHIVDRVIGAIFIFLSIQLLIADIYA